MENNKEEQPGLTDQLKEYLETRIKLARYQAIDKGTSFFANLITEVFVLLCSALTFFFATLTLAFLLGQLFGSLWLGFGCITLLYLFLAMIVSAMKDKHLEPRIINFLIKKILKERK
jgi:hypothetical protein